MRHVFGASLCHHIVISGMQGDLENIRVTLSWAHARIDGEDAMSPLKVTGVAREFSLLSDSDEDDSEAEIKSQNEAADSV